MKLMVIILTVATAAIHLALGIFAMQGDVLFILNGVGYLGLLAALYAPLAFLQPYRRWARWALMAFTAVTILAWVVITRGDSTPIGYLDKAIELALIVVLFLEREK